MHYAFNYGYYNHALELWASSGAASREFDNFKPNRQKSKTEAKKFHKEVEHLECECGAIVYEPSWCDGYCSSCGKENK
jgi:hypothetical protein